MKVEVVKSKKRRRTASARLKEGVLSIRVPAFLSEEKTRLLVEEFKKALRERKLRGSRKDSWLRDQVERLNKRYFGGRVRYRAVRWSKNQRKIYGSCSTKLSIIRVSSRLAKMPRWVLDYVVIHELAHLVEPNHSKAFWRLVNQYKRAERARGYLMGLGFREGNSDEI